MSSLIFLVDSFPVRLPVFLHNNRVKQRVSYFGTRPVISVSSTPLALSSSLALYKKKSFDIHTARYFLIILCAGVKKPELREWTEQTDKRTDF